MEVSCHLVPCACVSTGGQVRPRKGCGGASQEGRGRGMVTKEGTEDEVKTHGRVNVPGEKIKQARKEDPRVCEEKSNDECVEGKKGRSGCPWGWGTGSTRTQHKSHGDEVIIGYSGHCHHQGFTGYFGQITSVMNATRKYHLCSAYASHIIAKPRGRN